MMKNINKTLAVFMLLLICITTLPRVVFADDTYYGTWAEYQEGTGLADATWNHVAEAMDLVIETAKEKYAAGDADGAYDCINDAYYGYYETTGFERVAMGYISGARKSQMELQFSACKSVAKKGGSVDDFNAEADLLSEMLHEDANILDGTSGNSSQEEGDTAATGLFADNYYGTWAEYKAAADAAGVSTATWNDVVDAMNEVIEAGKALYAEGDAQGAYDCINDGYYGYYETTGFERVAMGYISGARKSQMELQFSTCKSLTKNGGSADDFNAEADQLKSMLREDAHILDGTTPEEDSEEAAGGTSRSAGVAAFIACFTILLREGFEAILIVGAIIAYLVKSADGEEERKRLTRPVYIGAVLGILASFVSAFLLNQLKLANSAQQEIIEGVTALIAVCVLYYVSNWMISKADTEAWEAYIKKQVGSAAKKGSSRALAFTAFLAVYREGAEVILFYQPMLSGDNINMVWAGFGVGCVALVFVYIAIRVLSLRLPLKPFFTGTSILMFIMSIAFLGSGIKELIEGDVITMTSPAWVSWIPSHPVLEILGIYPCAETVIPQIILLVITIIIFIWHIRKSRKLREEMAAGNA